MNTAMTEYNRHDDGSVIEGSAISDDLVVDSVVKEEMQREGRKDGGVSQQQMERWVEDIREQPAWRNLADRCADFYDGNQLTVDELAEMEEAGMAPIIANIVRPTVDVVLGMEAKTRQDWRVTADAGEFQGVAEALSAKLLEAEREADADRACSDAYAGQIKAGLGWVEVARSIDPFAYPYRCRYIHRREIWWDWRAKEPDLSDARFLLRKRWLDLDELIAIFPDQAELLEQAGSGRVLFDRLDLTREGVSEALTDAYQAELRTTIDDLEWRDTSRRMLCLTEMWYRTWHRGHVIKIGGKVIPVDTRDPAIAAAVAYGKVQVRKAVYSKVRLGWWVGPHRLADMETERRHFPYVPFFGFREDRTGAPYGLIKPMLDPQVEYNARRAKLMWLLSAKRVTVDSDALDTNYNDFKDIAREAGRPDMMAILNPNRRNANGLKVDTDHGLASQQFQVMADAEQLLQKTAGVYQAMMGQKSNSSSGLAINSLIEQGTTTLAEINDNYRYARRLVGQRLLELIVEDIGGEPHEVTVGEGKRAHPVILNEPKEDGGIANDVLRAPFKVALSDVPSTPSYRAQMLNQLTQLTQSLPPNIQGMIIDFVIESTDLPHRHEMAERIRNGMGIQDPEDMTPEQQEQIAAMQQQQQELEQAMQQLQMREQAATAAEKEARAAKAQADADAVARRSPMQAQADGAQAQERMAKAAKLTAETVGGSPDLMAIQQRIEQLGQAIDLIAQHLQSSV